MKTLATLLSAPLAAACLCACTSTPLAEAEPPPPAPASTDLSLSGDALFAFGKSGIEDITANGRDQLEAFALRLQMSRYQLVRISGHSDRIGSDQANMALSTHRAQAVHDYLLGQGIPAEKMVATGLGAHKPVVECDDEERQALIDCLAPNRRVEISVDAGTGP